MAQEKVKVIVEVNGGCVSNVVAGSFVDVQVIDWDNLLGDSGSATDTRKAWEELSKDAREFVEREYPEEFGKIQDAIKLAEDSCDCGDRSWYGTEHDSACPLAGMPKGANHD